MFNDVYEKNVLFTLFSCHKKYFSLNKYRLGPRTPL